MLAAICSIHTIYRSIVFASPTAPHFLFMSHLFLLPELTFPVPDTRYPTCSLDTTDDDFEGPCQFHENIISQDCQSQYDWLQSTLVSQAAK